MNRYRRIVVLTGAGISAESGIRTFRAADGLWEEHRIEDVASPQGFRRDPALVQRFYNLRRQQLQQLDIAPNAAHAALAAFEQEHRQQPGSDFLLVTQNIDNLHERAGTRNLVHMHGELLKARCTSTGHIWQQFDDITADTRCPCCGEAGTARPHVVWFGEMPLQMDTIVDALTQCDLFISIGTSGNVYPAAGFVEQANSVGAHTVELNLEPSQMRSAFREARTGPASALVPAFLASLLS